MFACIVILYIYAIKRNLRSVSVILFFFFLNVCFILGLGFYFCYIMGVGVRDRFGSRTLISDFSSFQKCGRNKKITVII